MIPQEELNEAFLVAVYNGYFGLAKKLLKHGANVNALDDMGKNALFYLTGPRRFESPEITEDSIVKFAKFLLNKGININKKNNHYTTPIRYAHFDELFEFYIMNGADPFIRNEDGNAFNNSDFFDWFTSFFEWKKINNYEELQKAVKEKKKNGYK